MSDIEKETERLNQTSNMNSLFKSVAPSEMLTVYYSNREKDHHTHGVFCALIPTVQVGNCLKDFGWDLHHDDGHPLSSTYCDKNGNEIAVYSRYGSNVGIEPLIIDRNFYDIHPGYKEINEEFRLFHNLYHDSLENKYFKIDDYGNEELIAIVKEDKIQIRLKEIQQFMAIKEMHLSIQFDYIEHSKYTLDDLSLSPKNNKKFTDKSKCWSLNYSEITFGNIAFSRLCGKFIIPPFTKSQSGMWGFTEEKPKKYVDFIIGEDDIGKEILNTCDPDKLNNYFDINPGAAQYLTPVDFRKTVLEKYYQEESKYRVGDGCISCGSLWGLQIDNHHADKVSVWLGDLGTSLSYEEQLHWRSYNFVLSGKVSDVYFKRQICAEFTDSDQPEHLFQVLYHKLADECDLKLGYRILLPLAKEDEYHLSSMHVPATDDQNKFDEQILSLTKILVDSINEKKLSCLIPLKDEKGYAGISKLKEVFVNLDIKNHEEHIAFLKELQELRSSCAAHRKGDNYKKTTKKLGITSTPLPIFFKQLLLKSNKFLNFLYNQVAIGSFNVETP